MPVPLLQQAADVLVVPNSAKFDISRLYTSPLKLFTSMTSGVPIVASDLPSLREIVDERTAIFFSPDSSDSLRSAILKIKNDKELAQTIAKNATIEVQKYSWINRAQKILDTIHV